MVVSVPWTDTKTAAPSDATDTQAGVVKLGNNTVLAAGAKVYPV